MNKNYYDILGVAENATKDQIKKAYRSLVRKHHPDKFQDAEKSQAEEKFKQINEAYSVLGDDDKRKNYDTYGEAGVDGAQGGFEGFDFQDIFSSFFDPFGSGKSQQQRGSDISVEMNITLDQAYNGGSVEVAVPRMEGCSTCNATGYTAPPTHCSHCKGQGYTQSHQLGGFFNFKGACRFCNGTGKKFENSSSCKSCYGKGTVRSHDKLDIVIPQGIESGQSIKIRGKGNAGSGGYSGDLYIKFNIARDKRFTRSGIDLECTINIGVTDAIYGTKVKLESISKKKLEVIIPSGIQSGEKLRIAGYGMILGGKKGSLYLKVNVVIPDASKFNDEEKEAWSNVAAHYDKNVDGNKAKFSINKFKEFFNKSKKHA